MKAIRAAAVQMRARVGDLDFNLSQAESLAREAFARGAQWVILPEFFASAMAFTPSMLKAWQPLEGRALQLMRKLAREHEGVVGGTFIAKRGRDLFNTFLLVFPDGSFFTHDKDIPTMWEQCYMIGGSDDGVLDTPAGPVGVALCWEMIRSQTARRLAGKVGLVVGGSGWWDLRLPILPEREGDQQQLLDALKSAPAQLARRVGAPVVHASHAGEFEGLTPGKESVSYASRFLGETQIVDADGQQLVRMSYEDGEGVILAEVTPSVITGERQGSPALARDPIPESFWTVDLPPDTVKACETLNSFGQEYYRTTMRPLL